LIKKSFIKTIGLLLVFTFIPSCTDLKNSKALPDDNYLGDYAEYFVYQEDNIAFFDVDNNGVVYIVKQRESGVVDNMVYAYDLNGELINSYTLFPEENYDLLSGGYSSFRSPINSILASDEEIYFTENATGTNILKSLSLETGTSSTISELPEGFEAFDMTVIGDKAFIIGIDEESSKKSSPSLEEIGEEGYLGEMIYSVHITTSSIAVLDIEFPVLMSPTLNNSLLIYAMSGEGYYFTEYDPVKNNYGEKYYNDLRKLECFRVINKNNDFAFSSPVISLLKLAVGSVSEEGGVAEIMPNAYIWGKSDINYSGGYTFYKNSLISSENHGKIERIKNSSYIKDVRKINMVSVGFFDDDPFGCGYTIKRESLTDDVFALNVLSRDIEHDIYLMNSNQPFSLNIKNKGSFYPLNDIRGVSEYIDACFPYIKDIATTEDGDIWMLPIGIEIPCILYNEKNIDITNLSNDDLIEAGGSMFINYLIMQYMNTYTTFDTAEFRELAEFSKAALNSSNNDIYFKNLNSIYTPGGLEKCTFSVLYYRSEQRNFTPYTNINALALPNEYSEKNTASLIFLCVNPSSKNLDAALDYISSLARYLYGTPDSMMFADTALYTDTAYARDLYDIYKNGDILFRLPNDVFSKDFYSYIHGETDIEFMIREIERKVNTFLNE